MESKYMTIEEIIAEKVNDYVRKHGHETVMTRVELYNMVSPNHTINYDSVLPQDYCYNRMNDGITFKDHIHLFEYLGRNQYRLMGDSFLYSGEIIHKPKRHQEVVAGKWDRCILFL